MVGERDRARAGELRAAADQRRQRRGVVRRLPRRAADQPRRLAERPGDRVHGASPRPTRRRPGAAAGPAAARPASSCPHPARPAGTRGARPRRRPPSRASRAPARRRRRGRARARLVVDRPSGTGPGERRTVRVRRDHLAQMLGAAHLHARHERRLGRIRRRDDHPPHARRPQRHHRRQHAAHPTQPPVQTQLGQPRDPVDRRRSHLLRAREQGDRDRQVEPRPALAQVRRQQRHRRAPLRPLGARSSPSPSAPGHATPVTEVSGSPFNATPGNPSDRSASTSITRACTPASATPSVRAAPDAPSERPAHVLEHRIAVGAQHPDHVEAHLRPVPLVLGQPPRRQPPDPGGLRRPHRLDRRARTRPSSASSPRRPRACRRRARSRSSSPSRQRQLRASTSHPAATRCAAATSSPNRPTASLTRMPEPRRADVGGRTVAAVDDTPGCGRRMWTDLTAGMARRRQLDGEHAPELPSCRGALGLVVPRQLEVGLVELLDVDVLERQRRAPSSRTAPDGTCPTPTRRASSARSRSRRRRCAAGGRPRWSGRSGARSRRHS